MLDVVRVTSLKHPLTNVEFEGDAVDTLALWLDEMRKLVSSIRDQFET